MGGSKFGKAAGRARAASSTIYTTGSCMGMPCPPSDHLSRGLLAQAHFPKDPLDVAWRHRLRAEYFKIVIGKDYSKERAVAEMQEAINVLRTASFVDQAIRVRDKHLRMYEQDLGWLLQYLRGRFWEAKAIYDRIIAELNAQPSELDKVSLAALYRNYAGCITAINQASMDALKNADEYLSRAIALLADKPHVIVAAEILYDRAKNAEQQSALAEIQNSRKAETSQTDQRARELLAECIATARDSGHLLVEAIARNRWFWKRDQFTLEGWIRREAELGECRGHAWAIRALLTGRLRTAKRLLKLRENEEAQRNLEENRSFLLVQPGFDSGSDCFRVAATWAGLAVLHTPPESDVLWTEFVTQFPWAGKWLDDQGRPTAEAVWARVD